MDKLDEKIEKRPDQKRQTDLAIVSAVKEEIRGHTQQDDQHFHNLEEKHESLKVEIEKLSKRNDDLHQKLAGRDVSILERMVRIETKQDHTNDHLKELNSKVPRNTEGINKNAEAILKLSVILESLQKAQEKAEKRNEDNNAWWKDKTFVILSSLGTLILLSVLTLVFKSQGIDTELISTIVEQTMQLQGG